jgi:prepilin-type N-terminal cleavage/methylation domain-containing protein
MCERKLIMLSGFSLIEMLVSMMIALIMLAMMIRCYQMPLAQLTQQTKQLSVLEKSDLLRHLITQAVHQAGHFGCVNVFSSERIDNSFSSQRMQLSRINFIEAAPHELTVRSAGPLFIASNIDSKVIYVQGKLLLKYAGIVSDCHHIQIFSVRSARYNKRTNTTKITSQDEIDADFKGLVRVASYHVHRYFVKKTRKKQVDGQAIYALYRQNTKGRNQRVLAGVKTIDFQWYGERLLLCHAQLSSSDGQLTSESQFDMSVNRET